MFPSKKLGASFSDDFDLDFVTCEETKSKFVSNDSDTKYYNLNNDDNCVGQKIIEYKSYLIKAIEEEITVRPDKSLFKKSNNGLYYCFKCNFSTRIFCHLKPHLFKHMLLKPYACLYCNFETVYDKSFEFHKNLHLEYKQPLTKLDSNFDFSFDISNRDNVSMIASASDVLVSDPSQMGARDTLLNCSSCSFKTKIPASLELHAKIHLKKEKLRCLNCTFEASTTFGLKIHLKRKHSTLQNHYYQRDMIKQKDNESQSFSCSLCPYEGTTLVGFKVHTAHHSKCRLEKFTELSEVFECKLCPYKSLSRSSFKKHISTIHSQERKLKKRNQSSI